MNDLPKENKKHINGSKGNESLEACRKELSGLLESGEFQRIVLERAEESLVADEMVVASSRVDGDKQRAL